MKEAHLKRALVLGCLALAGLLAAGSLAVAAERPEPAIEFPREPGVVVLEYANVIHMLVHQDPGPRLRIHADGRVRVHRPVYMVDAGEYEMRLSPAEMKSLFSGLAADGLLDLDAVRAKEELALARHSERAAGVLHHISDTTDTVFEIRLRSYRPAGVRQPISNYRQSFRWPNVTPTFERYPEVSAARVAALADARLRALSRAPELVKVR